MSTEDKLEKQERQTKILVVDDDVRLRDLLRRYLAENGFAVTTAENAQTMNRFWVRERFDLLVLDLMLPGEDGLSICRRLRGGGDQTPIIMLTAKGEDTDRIVGLEMGADDYLPKPFNPVNCWLASALSCEGNVRMKSPDHLLKCNRFSILASSNWISGIARSGKTGKAYR